MKYFVLWSSICFGPVYGYQVTSSTITPINDFEAFKQHIIVQPEAIVTTTHELSHQAKTRQHFSSGLMHTNRAARLHF